MLRCRFPRSSMRLPFDTRRGTHKRAPFSLAPARSLLYVLARNRATPSLDEDWPRVFNGHAGSQHALSDFMPSHVRVMLCPPLLVSCWQAFSRTSTTRGARKRHPVCVQRSTLAEGRRDAPGEVAVRQPAALRDGLRLVGCGRVEVRVDPHRPEPVLRPVARDQRRRGARVGRARRGLGGRDARERSVVGERRAPRRRTRRRNEASALHTSCCRFTRKDARRTSTMSSRRAMAAGDRTSGPIRGRLPSGVGVVLVGSAAAR